MAMNLGKCPHHWRPFLKQTKSAQTRWLLCRSSHGQDRHEPGSSGKHLLKPFRALKLDGCWFAAFFTTSVARFKLAQLSRHSGWVRLCIMEIICAESTNCIQQKHSSQSTDVNMPKCKHTAPRVFEKQHKLDLLYMCRMLGGCCTYASTAGCKLLFRALTTRLLPILRCVSFAAPHCTCNGIWPFMRFSLLRIWCSRNATRAIHIKIFEQDKWPANLEFLLISA